MCTPVFCRYRTRAQDCEFCKCKACDFCAPDAGTTPAIAAPTTRTAAAVPAATSAFSRTATAPSPSSPAAVIKPQARPRRSVPAPSTSTSSSETGTASTPAAAAASAIPAATAARLVGAAPAAERLQLRIDASLYPPSALPSSSCGGTRAACVAGVYSAELAAALEAPPGVLSVREASEAEGSISILLDLLPEPSGDLGSLSPAAQLDRLKGLVLRATHTSSRALRATSEMLRLRPPHGTAEPVLTAAEITSARRYAAIPATIAVAIVGMGVLVASIAIFSLSLGSSRRKPRDESPEYQRP